MTPTEQQIRALLERRPELTQFTPTYRWLVEAVEVLLRHQLELREELTKLMTQELCRQITKEVVEELRNNGIIR